MIGRIKTLQIKGVRHELMRLHADKFIESYENNKEAIKNLVSTQSKKLRNTIPGYV